MKIKNITLAALALSFTLASCNEWLDVMPDNRAEVDTEDKVASILVSAYPDISYIMCAELSSDNVDDFGSSVPAHNRILGQYFRWEDVTETDNEEISEPVTFKQPTNTQHSPIKKKRKKLQLIICSYKNILSYI